MRPYQYCSKDECIERQSLGQVSELESTLETCRLSQSNRVLDPRIAVSKYRRSAAGGNDGRPLRNRQQLQKTLSHLIQICATLCSSPEHPTVENTDTIVNFVVDRLRACQSDATRLMSNSEKCVPSSWHAKVIRVLIWLRYACCDTKSNDADVQNTARTIDHMRSTAYDAYWNTGDSEALGIDDDDDEMLCYHAISNICAVVQHSTTNYLSSLETSWNGITLEFQKRRRPTSTYPLWNLALTIASHARREEYYVLWKPNHSLTRNLPILAKSILSGEMLLYGRYRTVQHYNKSFGKGESVSDTNRLLGITESPSGEGWSLEYANVFGIPVEETENNEMEIANTGKTTIIMKLKQVPMPEFDSSLVNEGTISRIRKSDRHWIFGYDFDNSNSSPLGIPPKSICKLLEFGCSSSVNEDIDSTSLLLESDNNHVDEAPMSSLARALARNDLTNGISCCLSASDVTRTRPSPLQTALNRVKQKDETDGRTRKKGNGKKKFCRFFKTSSGCKFGDKCRFDHTL